MKIQIDTKAKEIIVEESVNLDDLFKMVKQLFPDNEWKAYKLRSQIINNWSYPIIYRDWTQPYYPWQSPIIYGSASDNTIEHTHYVVGNVQSHDHFATGLSTTECQTIYNVEF